MRSRHISGLLPCTKDDAQRWMRAAEIIIAAYIKPHRGRGEVSDLYGESCATCYFGKDGVCRKYPPTGSNVRSDRVPDGIPWLALWPHVKPDDWCGEHTIHKPFVRP